MSLWCCTHIAALLIRRGASHNFWPEVIIFLVYVSQYHIISWPPFWRPSSPQRAQEGEEAPRTYTSQRPHSPSWLHTGSARMDVFLPPPAVQE